MAKVELIVPAAGDTTDLAIQLAAAAALVILMTAVHGLGLVGIGKVLKLSDDRLEQRSFDLGAVVLMCGMALMLFALHIFEIWIFAAFYLLVGALETLDDALHYSASAYATLGQTDEPGSWQLIGAAEALIGFLLIGWSTAFIVSNVNKLRH